MHSPLFVVGFPRSGTTLLYSMLDQHSSISLVNHDIVRCIYRLGYNVGTCFDRSKRREVIESYQGTKDGKRHFTALSPSLIQQVLDEPQVYSFKQLYEVLLPKPEGVPIWGDKSHYRMTQVKDLLSIYPQCLFVHIIRDPRAVVISKFVKAVAKRERASVEKYDEGEARFLRDCRHFIQVANHWKRWQERVSKIQRSVDNNVIITVRYEELVLCPRKTLQRLCKAIGVVLEEDMLNHTKRASVPVLASQTSYAHVRLAQELDCSRTKAWKNLDPRLIWTVEQVVGDQMRTFDYVPECPPVNLLTQLAFKIVAGFENLSSELRTQLHRKRRLLHKGREIVQEKIRLQ